MQAATASCARLCRAQVGPPSQAQLPNQIPEENPKVKILMEEKPID